MTARTGDAALVVTSVPPAKVSKGEGLDAALPVADKMASTPPYYYSSSTPQYFSGRGGELILDTQAKQPLAFGWVTGQNKLDPNKHAVGTETLSLLAYPGSTVAASLANTIAEEQIDEPGHTTTEG